MVSRIEKPKGWKCDFKQLATVLEGKKPERPVLFELFINDELIRDVSGMEWEEGDSITRDSALIKTNKELGYDYAIVVGSDFDFPKGDIDKKESLSLNDGVLITDRKSYESYPWPEPEQFTYERLDQLAEKLPEGMKLMIWSPDGLLEAVIRLVGYENLCLMLYDDPELVGDIFYAVGSRFLAYFEGCVNHPAVAGVVSSDDWGFNTQTLLPTDVMREYLFPWQRKLVDLAHKVGKYAILHSCGAFQNILGDIVELGFDAKHSYEDNIWRVEEAYEEMKGKITVLGGMDLDFLCRKTPQEIKIRAKNMLEQTNSAGYALGTGNSVPDYIPRENYLAMLEAAYEKMGKKTRWENV